MDGDTFAIATDGGSLKARVIGIDTPETVHPRNPVEPFGPEASARARKLLAGQTVAIHYDPTPGHGKWDRYGRLLAYVTLPDRRDFGPVMIEEGLARAYTKYPCAREAGHVKAEAAARNARVGLWAATVPAETRPSTRPVTRPPTKPTPRSRPSQPYFQQACSSETGSENCPQHGGQVPASPAAFSVGW